MKPTKRPAEVCRKQSQNHNSGIDKRSKGTDRTFKAPHANLSVIAWTGVIKADGF